MGTALGLGTGYLLERWAIGEERWKRLRTREIRREGRPGVEGAAFRLSAG